MGIFRQKGVDRGMGGSCFFCFCFFQQTIILILLLSFPQYNSTRLNPGNLWWWWGLGGLFQNFFFFLLLQNVGMGWENVYHRWGGH
ncbi:hypothetical protein HOY80DRAFT_965590 [Tuber brumale]|nr:hypothetical protein HOY80DRAFT_965590 [Tuber brumale]